MQLSDLEMKIWNHGERLIPGRTHDSGEVRRHKSSYNFFCRVIRYDIKTNKVKNPKVLDLGFGCGFGCLMLASIPEISIHGIDISEECLEYASRYYSAANISYRVHDINNYVTSNKEFDYIVSRGVLEHIKNGLELINKMKWKKRLMFDVPYAESPRKNCHHLLCNITEKDFIQWDDIEIFYEDIKGIIYSKSQKPLKPNMIMGALSANDLPRISMALNFPMAPI